MDHPSTTDHEPEANTTELFERLLATLTEAEHAAILALADEAKRVCSACAANRREAGELKKVLDQHRAVLAELQTNEPSTLDSAKVRAVAARLGAVAEIENARRTWEKSIERLHADIDALDREHERFLALADEEGVRKTVHGLRREQLALCADAVLRQMRESMLALVTWLPLLKATRLDAAGRVVITSSRTRDQARNLDDARAKLAALVRAAWAEPKRDEDRPRSCACGRMSVE